MTRTGASDDTNDTGDLDLNADITIDGAGQEVTIIDGRSLRDRVMHILGQTVILNDLTIGGGQAPDGRDGADGARPGEVGGDGGDGQHGGGIYNQGTLTLYDCVVVSNRAGGASRFVSWSGGCSGTTPTCSVTMDAAKTVTATFDTEFVYLPLVLRSGP